MTKHLDSESVHKLMNKLSVYLVDGMAETAPQLNNDKVTMTGEKQDLSDLQGEHVTSADWAEDSADLDGWAFEDRPVNTFKQLNVVEVSDYESEGE